MRRAEAEASSFCDAAQFHAASSVFSTRSTASGVGRLLCSMSMSSLASVQTVSRLEPSELCARALAHSNCLTTDDFSCSASFCVMCDSTDHINKLSKQLGVLDLKLAERKRQLVALSTEADTIRQQTAQCLANGSELAKQIGQQSHLLRVTDARRQALEAAAADRAIVDADKKVSPSLG